MRSANLLLLGTLAAAVGCYTELKPGRCLTTRDCASGLSCNNDPNPQGNGRCVPRCTGAAECQDGRVCDFDRDGVGRCLLPEPEDGGGGATGTGGAGGDATGGVVGSGGAGGMQGSGGAAVGGGAGGGGTGATGGSGGTRECSSHQECPAARPACSAAGACISCNAVPEACGARDPGKPVCGPTGTCVECVADKDCSRDTSPICNTASHACERCTRDAQCAAKVGADPGVCMSHQDGRCAKTAETLFVENKPECVMATAAADAGSPQKPFCRLRDALFGVSGTPARKVVVVRGLVADGEGSITGAQGQITIVGQQNAVLAASGDPGLSVNGSDVFVRDIKIGGSQREGVTARNGAVLRLERVAVDRNAGGGVLVDGSGFEIRNSAITGNGPGTIGTTTWGGVLVQNPRSAGPAVLDLVTILNNQGPGLSCSTAVQGTGVLATGNAPVDVNPTCGITSCAAAGPMCGAQP